MKILVASQIDSVALDHLQRVHEVTYMPGADESALVGAASQQEALVFRSGVEITAPVLDALDAVRLIVRAGSGTDNIDLAHLERSYVQFVRIPGPGARAVAEMAFALMLHLARRLGRADRETRAGRWRKSSIQGRLLHGKVLGIVGAGTIGTVTGELGRAWGMDVIGCVEEPTEAASARLERSGIRLCSFDEVIKTADFVSIHVPLQDSTRQLIGDGELAKMKPGAILVNLSRGGVLDEEAVVLALETNHLGGVGLDVHAIEGPSIDSPLSGFDNVVLTPHIGASTSDTQFSIGETVLKVIDEYGDVIPNRRATPDTFVVI